MLSLGRVRISWMIRHPDGGRESLVSVGKTCSPPSHIGIGCRIIWHVCSWRILSTSFLAVESGVTTVSSYFVPSVFSVQADSVLSETIFSRPLWASIDFHRVHSIRQKLHPQNFMKKPFSTLVFCWDGWGTMPLNFLEDLWLDWDPWGTHLVSWKGSLCGWICWLFYLFWDLRTILYIHTLIFFSRFHFFQSGSCLSILACLAI